MSQVTKPHTKDEKVTNNTPTAGEDIDLSTYTTVAEELSYQEDPSRLPGQAKQDMLETGIALDDRRQRAGTFVQIDHSVVHSSAAQEGLEIMSSSEAREKYDWMEKYWGQAVVADSDKFTAQVELNQTHGYFIRALPGIKTILPVQTCLYLATDNLSQNVHNIIIAEEGSELHIITGCAAAHKQASGLHLGVSEFYVKKNAKITFTMIHNWTPDIAVRPRSTAIVEEGGVFLNYYICMRPVRTLQMYPTARCIGENAVAQFNSILVANQGANMDVGSRVILSARGSRAEIISRALTRGGQIIARGHLVGEVPDVKGHLECRGLILSPQGSITAIPELEGKVAGVDLSHEAAVGKIAEEELDYLMARGLTRDQATSAIVKGFISMDITGLPPELSKELQQAIESSDDDTM